MSPRPTAAALVEALRALNKAAWTDHPKWAAFSAETGKASELIANWDNAQRTADEDRLVTVCDQCLRASCWQGDLYCDNHKTAGTTRLPVRDLRSLGREHESYWEPARIQRIEGR